MTKDISGVHVWLVLIKAYHSISACTYRDLQGSSLGESDFRVLEVLLHKGALPVNNIGAKVFLTPGSISIAVERLCEKGLVSRTSSKTDRRVRVVDLTAKGRKLIEPVFAAHSKRMEELTGVLTKSERTDLIEALKKLGKNAAAVQP